MHFAPGILDAHEHVLGGSDERGLAPQTPMILPDEIQRAGVTTVSGTLGVDTTMQTITGLLARVKALPAGASSRRRRSTQRGRAGRWANRGAKPHSQPRERPLSAQGGTRTRKSRSSEDFESSASTSSTTWACDAMYRAAGASSTRCPARRERANYGAGAAAARF